MLINKINILDVMRKTKSNSNKQVNNNVANLILGTDPFDIEQLIELISLGNASCEEDKAADILENYLMASEDNTLMSAYFEIIEAYNKLFGFLKIFGYTIEEFKAEMEAKTEEAKKELKDKKYNENENVQLAE